jgi:hypothetical protein
MKNEKTVSIPAVSEYDIAGGKGAPRRDSCVPCAAQHRGGEELALSLSEKRRPPFASRG